MKYKQATEALSQYQENIVTQREFIYNFFIEADKINLFQDIQNIVFGDVRHFIEHLTLLLVSKNLRTVRHKLRKMYGSWNDRVTYISPLQADNTGSVFYKNKQNTIELHVEFTKKQIEKMQGGKCKFQEVQKTETETVLVCDREAE